MLVLLFLCPGFAEAGSLYEMSFTENKGQIIDDGSNNGNNSGNNSGNNIKYVSQSRGVNIYLTSSGISYVFRKADGQGQAGLLTRNNNRPEKLYRMDMALQGASDECSITAEEESGHVFNYYFPHCPDGITGVRSYRRITYNNVYNNIDMVCYGDGGKLKYEFVVKPGGKVGDIKINYDGAEQITLNENGSLSIDNPLGVLSEAVPYTYQNQNQNKSNQNRRIQSTVSSEFIIRNGFIQFEVGDYDRTKNLIIDPEVSWITYLGSSDTDRILGIASDDENNLIVSGWTNSIYFPVSAGSYQERIGGVYDAFIFKFDTSDKLMWGTFIGGAGNEYSFDITASGQMIWMSFESSSRDFPTTPDAYQSSYSGGTADIVLTKFSGSGLLLYSTYIGGSGYEGSTGITVDSDDNIWFTGRTFSPDFPIKTDDSLYRISYYDAILVKFSPEGELLLSKNIGGTASDFGEDIAFDANSKLIGIAGFTTSTDYPATHGTYQPEFKGQVDAFISKFNLDGEMIWSSFFGGSGNDYGSSIAVDGKGDFIMSGFTRSIDFPTSAYPYQKELKGESDCFVAKFNKLGFLSFSTYLGGSGLEGFGLTINHQQADVNVGPGNQIYLTGTTASTDFPVTSEAYQESLSGSSDAFMANFDADGDLAWSSYLGGSQDEIGHDIMIDYKGRLVVAGATTSADFPVTFNAFQRQHGGGVDGFIFRLGDTECEMNYNDFTDISDLKIAGHAEQDNDLIILTPSAGNVAGAVWFSRKVSLSNGFSAVFQFRMAYGFNSFSDGSAPGADGIVFVIQNSAPGALGNTGGGIGYEDIPNSIAVEFDTYWNYQKSDPNGNHVAVFSNGMAPNSSDHSTAANLGTNSDILEIIPDGRTYYVKIDYVINPGKLIVYIDSTGNYNNPVLEIDSVDIGQLLDLDQDCYAFIGIASATGDSWERHELLGWEYCSSPCAPLSVEYDNASRISVSTYPNPSNDNILINFSLGEPAYVNLKIYNLLGGGEDILINSIKAAGNYEALWNAANKPAGVYMYVLSAGNAIETGKIIIRK